MNPAPREEARRHREVLERLSGPEGPLRVNSPYATVKDPEFFSPEGEPRLERAELHNDIIQDFFQSHPDALRERQALVMAGPPGAGKSTVADEIVASAGAEPGEWLTISADDFKTRLLERAAADGSLERMVPPEVRSLEAEGEQFFPYDYSDLVHSESVLLAHDATMKAIEGGYNVVIDGTLSSEDKANALVENLNDAGYSVSIASVDTTAAIAAERAGARYDDGYARAAEAAPGTPESLGGRWLPPQAIAGLYAGPEAETSHCSDVARSVADRSPDTVTLAEYRVTAPDAAPTPAGGPPQPPPLEAAGPRPPPPEAGSLLPAPDGPAPPPAGEPVGPLAGNPAGPAPSDAPAPPSAAEAPPPSAAPADPPPEPTPH
jgi:predicted kinase